MSRTYYGQAGHFIAADDCRFHIHTHVGSYCVSSIGDYRPRGAKEPAEIGLGRTYETFVFRLNAARDDVESFEEIDTAGYTDRDAANEGHEAMVRKYEALP